MDPATPPAGDGSAPPPPRRFTLPLERCNTVGKLIVYYRELKGWRQKDLCYALGMTQSRLSSLERDTRQASFVEMERISFFLEQAMNQFSPLWRGRVVV